MLQSMGSQRVGHDLVTEQQLIVEQASFLDAIEYMVSQLLAAEAVLEPGTQENMSCLCPADVSEGTSGCAGHTV